MNEIIKARIRMAFKAILGFGTLLLAMGQLQNWVNNLLFSILVAMVYGGLYGWYFIHPALSTDIERLARLSIMRDMATDAATRQDVWSRANGP